MPRDDSTPAVAPPTQRRRGDDLAGRVAHGEAARRAVNDFETVRWFLDKRDDRTAWAAVDRIEARVRELADALAITHGTAQAMADLDSWIAEECGMVDDGENWYVPAARTALDSETKGADK